jgi:hypothetical protein
MKILENYETISFKENGYPANGFLRRVVYFVWRENSVKTHLFQEVDRDSWEFAFANMIIRLLPDEKREEATYQSRARVGKLLVDGLIEAGTLVAIEGRDTFTFAGNRQAPDTVEARSANFSGALKKLSEKTVKTPDAQRKLLKFLVDARNLYGFHLTQTTEGRAVMFPTGFVFDERGFRLNSATAFISTERGLEVWQISGDKSFQVFFEEGRPKFRITLDNAERNVPRPPTFSMQLFYLTRADRILQGRLLTYRSR